MTRILRSAAKKLQNNGNLSSKLTISEKSKLIKKRNTKASKIKNECSQKSSVWNINSIMSKIFAYSNRKDLFEFNIVCKKWNNITNPIIHKTIKLDNRWNITWQRVYKRINNAAKIDADVVECISNNAKHAPLVKNFKFNYKLKPLRAIEIFEIFRFICNLTIENCDLIQGQFLGMISPLTQLEELNIRFLNIKNIFRKNLYKEAVQLPSSLKKLKVQNISLIDNPELFVQTINSHSNLVEFSSSWQSNYDFLEPFYKNYATLLNFEFNNNKLLCPKSLLTVFEYNPQLVSLKLSFEYWNREFLSYISSYLTNLESLSLLERYKYGTDYTLIDTKLSQPTKIKKLYLEWDSLSSCSLNSILLNCPQLEELYLNPYIHYKQFNTISFINHFKFLKLKKLSVGCNTLSGCAFDSLLLSCPHLNELNIILHNKWKEVIKSIYEKCANLKRLKIYLSFGMPSQERYTFYQEFYKSEFFTTSSSCSSTLTHLTLEQFRAHDSKSEYFKNFEKLKSIKYPYQKYRDYPKFDKRFGINMDLWTGYSLISTDSNYHYDIEFKRF